MLVLLRLCSQGTSLIFLPARWRDSVVRFSRFHCFLEGKDLVFILCPCPLFVLFVRKQCSLPLSMCPSLYCCLLPFLCANQVEDIFRANAGLVIPASTWPTVKDDLEMDLIQMMKDQSANVSGSMWSVMRSHFLFIFLVVTKVGVFMKMFFFISKNLVVSSPPSRECDL